MDPSIISIEDSGRSGVLIWWTNVRAEQASSLAHNCGAWQLRKDDTSTSEGVFK